MTKFPLLLAALLSFAAPASALEWHTMGARAIGMGGTGVASSQGPLAAYWNPAALGRPSTNAYGLQVPFSVHAALTGSVIEGAKNLKNLKDTCASGGTCTNADIVSALNKLNDPADGLRVDAGVGGNFKVGKLAFFTNGFLDMGAVPKADVVHTANADLAGTSATPNTSKLVVKGANITEFGVGYGHELPFAPGLYLGGAFKIMSANVGYADYLILSNNNDQGNIVSALKNGAKRSANVGLDAGALWDLDRAFGGVALKPKIGLTGRNLNNPSFKQPDSAIAAGLSDKFKVNPQLRLGFALSPFNWWNLAADVDLTRNLTPVDGAASRQFGLGSEFNVFNRSWINIPLRVGLMRNVAETSAGTMLTAGAGLNFLHVLLDVSAAVSNKRVNLQSQGKDEKIPREVALGVQLSVLFGGEEPGHEESSPRTAPSEPNAEPAAPKREWKAAPKADDQPVPTEKVRQAAEKAQLDLKAEELKNAAPKPKPSVTNP